MVLINTPPGEKSDHGRIKVRLLGAKHFPTFLKLTRDLSDAVKNQ